MNSAQLQLQNFYHIILLQIDINTWLCRDNGIASTSTRLLNTNYSLIFEQIIINIDVAQIHVKICITIFYISICIPFLL